MSSSSSERSSTLSHTTHHENLYDVSYSHSEKLYIPFIIAKSSSEARDEECVARNAEEWSRFMCDATFLVYSRYSLARALGFDIEDSVSDPERLASTRFTVMEMEMFQTWKRNPERALPPVSDWKAIQEPLKASTSAQFSRWNENTDALRALYGRSDISREHCKGWMEKNKNEVPLLIAMKKVLQTQTDAEAMKMASSSDKRCIHEIMACRKIISEIGKYRIESNAITKELSKYVQEKEAEFTQNLSTLEREKPSGAQEAKDIFIKREKNWKELTELRVERLEKGGRTTRQNMEIISLERSLQERITALESRLHYARSDR